MAHYDAVAGDAITITLTCQRPDKSLLPLGGATGIKVNYKTGGVWAAQPAQILDIPGARLTYRIAPGVTQPGDLVFYFEGLDVNGDPFTQRNLIRKRIRARNP